MKTLEEIKKEFEKFWTDLFGGEYDGTHPQGQIWNFIEKAISQSKEEMVEEIKKKLRKEIMFNNDRITKTTNHWDEQDWTFYGKREALKDFLEDLNKK